MYAPRLPLGRYRIFRMLPSRHQLAFIISVFVPLTRVFPSLVPQNLGVVLRGFNFFSLQMLAMLMIIIECCIAASQLVACNQSAALPYHCNEFQSPIHIQRDKSSGHHALLNDELTLLYMSSSLGALPKDQYFRFLSVHDSCRQGIRRCRNATQHLRSVFSHIFAWYYLVHFPTSTPGNLGTPSHLRVPKQSPYAESTDYHGQHSVGRKHDRYGRDDDTFLAFHDWRRPFLQILDAIIRRCTCRSIYRLVLARCL
jgi:hypothetical protein